MSTSIIRLPRLNDGKADYLYLFEIWRNIQGFNRNIRFDFTACDFLRPNAVAFLGGAARYVQMNGGVCDFDWGTINNNAIRANLCQNGFAKAFGYPDGPWMGHSIPYREDLIADANSIMDYLTEKWLGRGWVHVSNELTNAIVGHMWEIYNNAFEHSETPIGVVSCGQHFKKHNELILSTIDFGYGIARKARTFFENKNAEIAKLNQISDGSWLKWAFKSGNSTTSSGVPRGLGLGLLKEFVCKNQGKLEIYSNSGYARIDHEGDTFETLNASFSGTIVQITLKCDERLYRFQNE